MRDRSRVASWRVNMARSAGLNLRSTAAPRFFSRLFCARRPLTSSTLTGFSPSLRSSCRRCFGESAWETPFLRLPALSSACQENAAMDQSSPRPATRMTSSSVVFPSSTSRIPADWILSVLVRACASISCSPAPEWIRLCKVLSIVMYS